MKTLIVQIPCYNEERSLGITLTALPKAIAGFDVISILVIDDGSTDRTIDMARAHGVAHVLALPAHVGLAQAFAAGLREALRLGADAVVNLDADNQYCAADIQALVDPLLRGEYEVVVGERDIGALPYFSPLKKRLHWLGNGFLRLVSGLPVRDATSGFRAISREAAGRIRIYSHYTYTVEMLLQLAFTGMRVQFVPIRTNREILRPSRLIKNNAQYLLKTLGIIAATLLRYRPAMVVVPALALLALCIILAR